MELLESQSSAGRGSTRELKIEPTAFAPVGKPDRVVERDLRERRPSGTFVMVELSRAQRQSARATGAQTVKPTSKGVHPAPSAAIEPLRAEEVARYAGEVLEVGEHAVIRLGLPDGDSDEVIPVSRLKAADADFVGARIEYRVFEAGSVVASHIVRTGPPAHEVALALDWRLTSGLLTFAEDDES
jgi:hypothetical protein